MKTFGLKDALGNAKLNRNFRAYPDKSDPRYVDGVIYPHINPKFQVDFVSSKPVFTIGSCFARHIEDALEPLGVQLPTKKFTVPHSEWPNPANCLLNEYNPGSISQKIISTIEGTTSSTGTIYQYGDSYFDLLLCGGSGVDFERAIARRAEIADIYAQLPEAEIVIVTLGFVECWFDQETKSWLNRMPPLGRENEHTDRFVLKRLDADDAMALLTDAFERLTSLGKKIILTVSPVPLSSTFTYSDCLIANEYSKSVLRVCAGALSDRLAGVDYFPSYEIARTAGLLAYEDDNVQVRNSLVTDITKTMIGAYSRSGSSA